MAKKKKLKLENIPCKGLKPSKHRGFSCKTDVRTAKKYICTHRACSKGYDELKDIPISAHEFIDSTG